MGRRWTVSSCSLRSQALGAPQRSHPSLLSPRCCHFGKIKISKTPVSSLSDAQTGGGLLSCASRLSRPPQGEELGYGRRLVCLKSALIQNGLAEGREFGSGMPACLHAQRLHAQRLAAVNRCRFRAIGRVLQQGVKDHRGQYGEGSPRKPAGACGSLRTLPVSARVCLDLETADEEGCLRGCVLEEDERPTRRREAEGKSPSLLSPCTDPGSTPVLQIPRRPKECPGSVACHVHRRRFVALLSCWTSRAKSALTPHTSLCLTHPLAVCPAEPALPCRLRLESGPHLPPPEFTFSRPSPRGTSIPSTTARLAPT